MNVVTIKSATYICVHILTSQRCPPWLDLGDRECRRFYILVRSRPGRLIIAQVEVALQRAFVRKAIRGGSERSVAGDDLTREK